MTERNSFKYRPKLRRPKPGEERYREPPPIKILPMDIAILDYVYKCRMLSSKQLYALLWAHKGEFEEKDEQEKDKQEEDEKKKQQWFENRVKKRLQLLWLNKFVDRPPDQQILRIREGMRYLVYGLGNKGAKVLAEKKGYDIENIRWTQKNQVKFPFIKHALFVSQFYTCLDLALREEQNLELIRWKQGKEIQDRLNEIPEYLSSKQVRADKPLIQPDALFLIYYRNRKGSRRQFFFLEADRGTVREKTMLVRYKKYYAYWQQRGYVKQGIPEDLGFRVLTVSTNPTRAENLKKLIKENEPWEGHTSMFWFAHEQWSIKEPSPILGKCWKTAKNEKLHSIAD